ncbi:glutathione S-transferase [Paraburkholderia sp. GAS448]
MKLYYSPGACSLASHIVAREVGIAIELEKVDISSVESLSQPYRNRFRVRVPNHERRRQP